NEEVAADCLSGGEYPQLPKLGIAEELGDGTAQTSGVERVSVLLVEECREWEDAVNVLEVGGPEAGRGRLCWGMLRCHWAYRSPLASYELSVRCNEGLGVGSPRSADSPVGRP